MQATFNIPNALAAQLAKEYRRQLDLAAQADIHEAIRQGGDHVANGRTRPADEFFAEFRESMATGFELTWLAERNFASLDRQVNATESAGAAL